MRNLDFKGKFIQITESDGYLSSYEVVEIRPNRDKSGVIIIHETGQLELIAEDCGVSGVPFDDFDDLNDWLNSKLVSSSVAANFGTTSDNQATSDTGTFTFMSLFKRLLAKLTSGLSVGGKMGEPVEVTLTRPNDAFSYAVNDVISSSATAPTAIIFDLATAGVPAGGSGYIVKLRAVTNFKTWTGRIRLHLYKTVIVPPNDNTAFGLLWANRNIRLGYIDIPAFTTADATASDSAISLVADLRFPFKLAAGETRIWAICQCLDAQAPNNNQVFLFSLLTDNN